MNCLWHQSTRMLVATATCTADLPQITTQLKKSYQMIRELIKIGNICTVVYDFNINKPNPIWNFKWVFTNHSTPTSCFHTGLIISQSKDLPFKRTRRNNKPQNLSLEWIKIWRTPTPKFDVWNPNLTYSLIQCRRIDVLSNTHLANSQKNEEITNFLTWGSCFSDERPRKRGGFSQNTSIALEKRCDVHKSTKSTGGNMMPFVQYNAHKQSKPIMQIFL